MGKDNKKLEQRSIFEITKKLEEEDLLYFDNPLLQYLTSTNFSDNEETALHLAFFHRRYDCAIILLENGAKFDMKNFVKQRPVDVLVGQKDTQLQFLYSLVKEKITSNEDLIQMCNMIKRKINKIKQLSQNEIDEQNNILLTHSDTLINSNQLIDMEGSCLDDIPLEASPNQILEFKTKHFFQILDLYTTSK